MTRNKSLLRLNGLAGITFHSLTMKNNPMPPEQRLFIATCIKALRQAQQAAKNKSWVKDNMDAKINRIIKEYEK